VIFHHIRSSAYSAQQDDRLIGLSGLIFTAFALLNVFIPQMQRRHNKFI
jgi:hypothetical protein